MIKNTIKKIVKVAKKSILDLGCKFQPIDRFVTQYKEKPNFSNAVKFSRPYKRNKIVAKYVLLESCKGLGLTSGIFNAVLEISQIKPDLTFFVVVGNADSKKLELLTKYKVKYVTYKSRLYRKILTSAQYIITDYTLPSYFIRKPGQWVINTTDAFDGIFIDGKSKKMRFKEIQQTLFQSTHIMFKNEEAMRKLLTQYNLADIYRGHVTRLGCRSQQVVNQLRKLDYTYSGKHCDVLICIWNDYGIIKVENLHRKLKQAVHGGLKISLLVNPLYYEKFLSSNRLQVLMVPKYVMLEQLLATSKIKKLYSDNPSHLNENGLVENFILKEESGGDISITAVNSANDATTASEAVAATAAAVNSKGKVAIASERHKSDVDGAGAAVASVRHKSDAGVAASTTERLFESILLNKEGPIWENVDNDKQNIIMYCGGFFHNGITTSALNLSNNIDYNKYNLIILDKAKYKRESWSNYLKLNPNAKNIYRVGTMNLTFFEFLVHDAIINGKGMRDWLNIFAPAALYQRELKRMLGETKVDIAIDFSGYVGLWSAILAFSTAKVKTIYQHNDMAAETLKQVNGVFTHKDTLPRVFSLYKYYDNIISVSDFTKELNAKNLSDYAPYEKFKTINNSIIYDDILDKKETSSHGGECEIGQTEYIINDYHQFGLISLLDLKVRPQSDNINFINIGRLSPEKDQEKLILAFKQVLDEHTDQKIKLFLLGDGALKSYLTSLIHRLNLSENVILLGQVINPYYYLSLCDCFVLSSNHEGQPMVLLEALTVGIPIIATDIEGNRGVLANTKEVLVENNVESLANAMSDFVSQYKQGLKRKNQYFDYTDYNKQAMQMFYENACAIAP